MTFSFWKMSQLSNFPSSNLFSPKKREFMLDSCSCCYLKYISGPQKLPLKAWPIQLTSTDTPSTLFKAPCIVKQKGCVSAQKIPCEMNGNYRPSAAGQGKQMKRVLSKTNSQADLEQLCECGGIHSDQIRKARYHSHWLQ